MPILAIYELVKRFFLPIILPASLCIFCFYKGCEHGRSACEEEHEEIQESVEKNIREAEVINQKIQSERVEDKIDNIDRSLDELVKLFNAKYGRQNQPNSSS